MKKDIFVINPAAGKPGQAEAAEAQARRVAEARGLDYQIVKTAYKGQATEEVSRIAAENPDVTCRFYACGGDGTVNEVVCGAAGHANAQMACYPCGTGNDFIKIFSGKENFLDMEKLVDAPTIPLDLIRINDKYAINLCSAGIDARVADWGSRHSRSLPVSGKLVYDISILVNFFSRIWRHYEVELDGERLDGDYAIIVGGSGRYYGGGFCAIPESEPDDGLLDFVLVRRVSHLKLLQLIGRYQEGRHQEFGDLQLWRRGRRIVLRSASPEPCNYDGEIMRVREAVIELAPWKLEVALPAGSELIRDAGAKLSK